MEEGKVSIGKLGMGKAWVTKVIRETARIGREMLGGNGIISDKCFNIFNKFSINSIILY